MRKKERRWIVQTTPSDIVGKVERKQREASVKEELRDLRGRGFRVGAELTVGGNLLWRCER